MMEFRSFRQTFFPNNSIPTSISQCKNLELLGSGVSGIVYAMDRNRVIKQYMEPNEIEYHAFIRIGSHPHIVNFLGLLDDGCIILERGKLLRHILLQTHDKISQPKRMQWLRDAAEAIEYIHRKGIIHADIGCHNMILVGRHLKLIDFEGCSIDGSPAGSCYEWFSYRNMNSPISIQNDIFAYGCTIYEIMTGKPPYHELADAKDRHYRIQQLYQDQRFPDVSGLLCGRLMERCWNGNFNSMSEIVTALEHEMGAVRPANSLVTVTFRLVQSVVQSFVSRMHQVWAARAWWYPSLIGF